jgi:hypothetical protein
MMQAALWLKTKTGNTVTGHIAPERRVERSAAPHPQRKFGSALVVMATDDAYKTIGR